MTKEEFVDTLNNWGGQLKPFLFIADFEMNDPQAFLLDDVDSDSILFDIEGFSNAPANLKITAPQIIEKEPPSFNDYATRFQYVFERLAYGDSYLTNLTASTRITLSHCLRDIFYASSAKYKLWYKDDFLVFSPECFVKISNGKIFSFPMKGTIDAGLPNAGVRILEDQKELAEHVTIVDLIRNDLSQVATGVEVKRFRYIDELRTNHKNLLQVSSEIAGELPDNYPSHLGSILSALLPAGSVSGAPKQKTVGIIKDAEKENRGFYTGVFGYFDGRQLNSGVMIRFIERRSGSFFYRSGGGITTQSVVENEYLELINKVYVPVD